MQKIKAKISELKGLLTKEESRIRIQFICIYVIFAIVSLMMTIINIFTPYRALMWSTTIFTILMILDVVASIKKGKFELFIRYLFSLEIIALFTFFLIVGQPEGFSALWCSILPLGGMILYRRKNGTIISAVMLVIIIVCFWIPWKDMGINLLQYEYTGSFKLRFPVFYISCYAIGLFFESIRLFTHRELEKSRNQFFQLSYTDILTGLNNRNSYEQKLKFFANIKYLSLFVAFIDANGLHKLNDEQGHDAGDRMLICIANELKKEFGQDDCYRIGGDEFVVMISFPDEGDYRKRLNDVADRIQEQGYSVAKGMNLVRLEKSSITEIVAVAEKDMYKDKNDFYKKSGIDRRLV